MLDLKERMTAEEYEYFTTKGYFTIRRSDKFWCGTWSDMTIEQSLMRTMKCIGGLTHGRGVQDSVLSKWTLGMVFLHNVCDEVEKFCDVAFSSSEQHVEMRSSRINRDSDDAKNLMDWLCQHSPFPEVKELMSISTGVIGDEKINCHMSQEVGSAGISKIIVSDFYTVKFKRNDRIKSLGVMNAGIRIEDDIVPINPVLIFQRMCIAKESDKQLENFFTYELAPFPLSLFSMTKACANALNLLNIRHLSNILEIYILEARCMSSTEDTYCTGSFGIAVNSFHPFAIIMSHSFDQNIHPMPLLCLTDIRKM